MSRDDGFPTADMDTALLADPKVVALARRQRDPIQTAATVGLFVGLVLASWRAARPLTLDESLPAWWLEDVDAIRSDLTAVGLVDADGRVQPHAWASWFETARKRRDDKRERDRGYAANRRSESRGGVVDDSSASRAAVVPSYLPTLPTQPTDPSGGQWEGFGDEWAPFLAAWGERFRLPPSGAPDRPRTQRAVLWEIVGAYPVKAAGWCRSAPRGASSHEVVAHVRAQWRKAQEPAA